MNRLPGNRTLLFLLLFVGSTQTGCCQLETVAQSFAHWGETRANCSPPDTCTPGCQDNCVSLQAPQGYLGEGPTFAGDQITGPTAKTAVDRLVEVDSELEEMRRDNQGLREQLESAQETIAEQGRAIDSAGDELRQAVVDYRDVRSRLERWNTDLDTLNSKINRSWQDQHRVLKQFEDELESVLAESPDVPSPVSLETGAQEQAPPAYNTRPVETPSAKAPRDSRLDVETLNRLVPEPAVPAASLVAPPVNESGAVTLQPPRNLASRPAVTIR